MRVITRADFDGLVCGVLLSEVENIQKFILTHARDIHYQKINIQKKDIIANLPYDSRCSMWFDHHSSEAKAAETVTFKGAFELVDSCGRVIYNYYQKKNDDLQQYQGLVKVADKIDAARLTIEEIREPSGWVLLANTLQQFFGYEYLSDFEDYFIKLIHWIKGESVYEILERKAVQNRIRLIEQQQQAYIHLLQQNSYTVGNIIVNDMRRNDCPYYGNRFLIYTLFPGQNISIKVFQKKRSKEIIFACGHNIFKRDSNTNVGKLMKKYGGGGHSGAGTCHTTPERANTVLKKLITQMLQDG